MTKTKEDTDQSLTNAKRRRPRNARNTTIQTVTAVTVTAATVTATDQTGKVTATTNANNTHGREAEATD